MGDRVFGLDRRRFGTYAQYACWPQGALLAKRPVNLTDEEVAALPYGGLLASRFLRKGGLHAGQRVLVYGASGAVGTSAVQLARYAGAHDAGVCSTANLELVASLGAVAVLDYTAEDFRERSQRYDLILDAVGKTKSAAAFRRCRHPTGSKCTGRSTRGLWSERLPQSSRWSLVLEALPMFGRRVSGTRKPTFRPRS